MAMGAASACSAAEVGGGELLGASEAALTPSDPGFSQQWSLRNTGQLVSAPSGNPVSQTGARGVDINATKAWDLSQGASSVIVAVIDEQGVQVAHEDLQGRIFVNSAEVPGDGVDNDHNGYVDDYKGYDFSQSGALGNHGTLAAGIIAASASNGKGGAGIAPGVRVLPIVARIGDSAQMVAAIGYARSMGAKIVNLSQGSAVYDAAVYAAIRDSGMLFTISAGNRGTAAYGFPASFDLPNILSVASLENLGRRALTSNYGEEHVDIAAPGWNIYGPFALGASGTPVTNAYGYMSGTSFAAPHVAGVAALLMSRYPTWSVTDVANRILASASKVGALSGMVKTGGTLDAYAALAGVAPFTPNATTAVDRITLSWPSQSGATRYDVEVDGSVVSNALATNYVHSGLVAGSLHVYRVRAVFGSSVGDFSVRTIQSASVAPTLSTVSVNSAHNYSNNSNKDFYVWGKNAVSMRVHFSRVDVAAVNNDDTYDCLFYNPSEQEEVDTCGRAEYIVHGRYAGFWTHFDRVPFHAHLETDASLTAWGFNIDKIEYFTGIPGKPSTPYALPVSASSLSIGYYPASGSEKTHVYRASSSNGSFSKIATLSVDSSGQGNAYVNSGLVTGQTYYYKVSNSNGLGEGPLSDAVAATASAP
ncbi:MAG: S8 family serine peptidase [Polyangiaceae bacterium]